MTKHGPHTSSLALGPSEWREALRMHLIDVGFAQDEAAMIARRVIENLVRSYLSGGLEAHPRVTRSLDEAA